MKSLILQYHEQLKSGKVTPADLINNAKALADKYAFTNSIITPIFKTSKKQFDENNLLSCIPYSLKDNISTEGIRTTAGSRFLEDYIPPYNASVYGTLKNQGATLIAKDALDEFALGGVGIYCYTGVVRNPYDKDKISGGSSSGSVVNVATGISTFAIASDTGDSIRRPASLTGVVGYKPTYGAISRYGVLPFAPSFDHVGIVAKYVADATIVAQTVIKHDAKDYGSTNKIKDVKLANLANQKGIKFVILTNLLAKLDAHQQQLFNQLLQKLKDHGHSIIEAQLHDDVLPDIIFAYKALTFSEAYSCYSNMQGITFGKNESSDQDDYEQALIKTRSKNIGDEVKRRFVLGAFLTTKHNMGEISLAARRIRHMIQEEQLRLLKLGDCILMPSCSSTALPINDCFSKNNYDDWLMMDNFSGTPSITIPFTKINNLPWGLSLSCDIYQDMKLLNIAYTLENIIGGNDE